MSAKDQPGRTTEEEIDLRDLFGALLAGKWTIISAVLVAGVLGLVLAVLGAPTYRASALLELERRGGSMALPTEMQNLMGQGDSRVLTEIEIIRSRVVLAQVVETLKLDIIAAPKQLPYVANVIRRYSLPDIRGGILNSYAWSSETIAVGELEVPAEWLGMGFLITSNGDGTYTVQLPDGSSRDGKVKERLADDTLGFALRVDTLEGAKGREFSVVKIGMEQAVAGIKARLSVNETVRQSSVLQLDYIGPDRALAARTLDAVLDAYLGQNVSRGSAEAAQSLDFIANQLPQSEKAVTDAQNALNEYRQKQQSVDLTYETEALLGRVTEIEQKLSELALLEQEYKQKFTVNHPTYQALLQNRAKLSEQLADLKQESGGLPETQKEVFNLTRNLEVAQNVYLALLNRQQELQVVQASVVGNVRVLDGAFASPAPIAPRRSLIVAVALFAGFGVGVGLVILRRMFHVGVRGAEDLEKLGLSVFATIGLSPKQMPTTGRQNLPILAVEDPTDLVIEAMRSLRTSLHFGLLDAKTRSIVITSAAPEAGKSFTAVNLAAVAAQAGQRICLIDADLRRGYLRRYFGVERQTPGLGSYLAGELPLKDVILKTKVDGLSFISTGPLPPNPAELLMRPAFSEMLEKLNEEYDLVLIDSPPTLAVTDPVVMGRIAGASIMIVRYNKTAVGEVEAVMRNFETAGGRIAGAILNGVEANSLSYGNRYYYYNRRYEYKSTKQE